MRMGQMTRGVTHAVATGAGWRSRHIEQWGIEPAKVSVIQNGTALVELLSREQLRAFAPERDDACLRVAYVGSFDPWQGLPTLLRAVSSVVASGASIELRIAGAGREEATLRSMTHQLGLERRVRFLGHLPVIDLGRCLCDCDVGVSLYHGRAEFTGLKLLDYKAAGLATVAVGDGGQPDVIEHGKTGVIVPPDDEQAVVSALLALSRDRAWQGQLGREARRSAEARHSWRHTVQALDNLFQRLLRPDLAQGERIADATPVGG
jgi:glycosyltransferase involved in cell wall biosynthesis